MTQLEEKDIRRWRAFDVEQTTLISKALSLLLEKGELTEEQRALAERLREEAEAARFRHLAYDAWVNW